MTGREELSRFCPSCASSLATAPPSTCDTCGYALFVNPRPTGSVIICAGPSVLIVQRARDPKAGEGDLDCFWLARIVAGEPRLDPSELLAYRWVSLAHPPRLAFPSMDAALADAAPKVISRV